MLECLKWQIEFFRPFRKITKSDYKLHLVSVCPQGLQLKAFV